MRCLPVIATVAALLASTVAPQAATITTTGTAIAVEGQINQGDAVVFLAQLLTAASHGSPIEAVSLNSPGGLINEGRVMADAIRNRGLITIVYPNKMCASACFLMLAAGPQRVVGEGARIGIHSATMDLVTHHDDANGTLLMARYLGTLGVPQAIVGQLVETTSGDIAWLSDDDLRSMGVTRLDQKIDPPPQRVSQPRTPQRGQSEMIAIDSAYPLRPIGMAKSKETQIPGQ